MWLIALHHQACHAKRAVDASPPIARQIEDDEQITGKEWRYYGCKFARVTNCLLPLRQKSPKSLISKLTLSAYLTCRQRVNDVPPFPEIELEQGRWGHRLRITSSVIQDAHTLYCNSGRRDQPLTPAILDRGSFCRCKVTPCSR